MSRFEEAIKFLKEQDAHAGGDSYFGAMSEMFSELLNRITELEGELRPQFPADNWRTQSDRQYEHSKRELGEVSKEWLDSQLQSENISHSDK